MIQRIAFLDILRFVAAIIVLVAHMHDEDVIILGLDSIKFDLKNNLPILHSGVAGVIIFFLITGYIIPQIINNYKNSTEFLINRCIRIYPLLIFLTLINAIISNDFQNKKFLGLLLPIADFVKFDYATYGVEWTLRIEFWYYIVIALMFYNKILNFKNIILLIIINSLLIISTYIAQFDYFNYRLIYINFIFLGSLLFYLENENFKSQKHIIITILTGFFSIAVFEIFRLEYRLILFQGVLFGSIVFIIFYLIQQTKYRIKSNKFTKILGDISYPCYLLHLIMYNYIHIIFKSPILSPIIFLFICCILNIFVEKPIIKLLKKPKKY
jgi:peptidoglycan/LPS O-acetylase OafA/YrhL